MPSLVVVVGPAGSGKSSVARTIARRYHLAHLDKDSMTGPLTEQLLLAHGQPLTDRDANQLYLTAIRPLEYQALLQATADVLRGGVSVVIDAPFTDQATNQTFLVDSAAHHHWPAVNMIVVHVHANPGVVRARLTARALARDTWKLTHWDTFWSSASGRRPAWEGATHLTIFNNDNEPDLTALIDLSPSWTADPDLCGER